jgi:hypothetical protein
MAVRIPIITVFDSKGLRQAQNQLNKVRGNFQALGRNFAIAGAAFAGAAAVIVKSAQSLARIEKINAQTEAVLKSMGNSAGVSAKHIEDLAGNLENLTATEAETIQEGANLLLTFRNIRNQVGKNNDIFDQAVAISVDLARAMGTEASGEAIRLGKALNDPVKGIAALTRVGVSFTQQQKDQIKALQDSGNLLEAQKIILAELQAQFGGSGAAYAKTFAGQLELLNHELGTLGEEATMAVMPALRDMVGQLRELAPEIGVNLKNAIASVDWKAFAKTIVDLITFFTRHGETIAKVVTALFLLNTAYNVVKISVGIINAAMFILGNTFVVTAGKIGLATGAVKLFRTALVTTGIGALVVGLGFIIEAIINTNEAAANGKPYVTSYGGAIRKSGKDADWAAGRYGAAAKSADNYVKAISRGVSAASRTRRNELREKNRRSGLIGGGLPTPSVDLPVFGEVSGGGGGGGGGETRAQKAARLEREALQKRKEAYKSFAEAVSTTFGQIKDSILSSFSLPSLGNSVNSITRNMRKLLEQTKSFASNIGKLSGLGLNPALLQQVIQAGPMAGGQLAAAIVAGGSSFVSQLNTGFGEFGGLASQIAGVGVASQFGTQQTVNNYNISVNGGLATGASIGQAIVTAITNYERQSGAAWRA